MKPPGSVPLQSSLPLQPANELLRRQAQLSRHHNDCWLRCYSLDVQRATAPVGLLSAFASARKYRLQFPRYEEGRAYFAAIATWCRAHPELIAPTSPKLDEFLPRVTRLEILSESELAEFETLFASAYVPWLLDDSLGVEITASAACMRALAENPTLAMAVPYRSWCVSGWYTYVSPAHVPLVAAALRASSDSAIAPRLCEFFEWLAARGAAYLAQLTDLYDAD